MEKQKVENKMVAKASAKSLKTSAQKANLVLKLIRGVKVEKAISLLEFSRKRISNEILKVLKSAVSNAFEKGFTDSERIYISHAYSTEGPTAKRFKARAMGRATRRLKRSSHITIILEEKSA